MNNGGYIKIYRKFKDWCWYSDLPVFRLFFHMLLHANWEDNTWKGITVKRGQLVRSVRKLAAETGLTEQQTKTAINKLQSTHEITSVSTNKFTLYTIVKYDTYQTKRLVSNQLSNTGSNPQSNKQITHNLTTDKEERNKEPPIVPQRDGEGSIKKSDWDAFCKHFMIDRISLTPDLTDEVISHLLSVLREQSRGAKIRVPLSVAKKRAEEGEADRQDKRAVQAWLHPPPCETECHCGGELEKRFAPGSGETSLICLECGRAYPKR